MEGICGSCFRTNRLVRTSNYPPRAVPPRLVEVADLLDSSGKALLASYGLATSPRLVRNLLVGSYSLSSTLNAPTTINSRLQRELLIVGCRHRRDKAARFKSKEQCDARRENSTHAKRRTTKRHPSVVNHLITSSPKILFRFQKLLLLCFLLRGFHIIKQPNRFEFCNKNQNIILFTQPCQRLSLICLHCLRRRLTNEWNQLQLHPATTTRILRTKRRRTAWMLLPNTASLRCPLLGNTMHFN